MDASVNIIEISDLRYVPELLAWAIGITLAVIMVRRGGRNAEKLLLAGCALMLLAPLSSLLFNNWLTERLLEQDRGYLEVVRHPAWVVLNIGLALFRLGGLVCLIWAFVVRFRTKKPEAA